MMKKKEKKKEKILEIYFLTILLSNMDPLKFDSIKDHMKNI